MKKSRVIARALIMWGVILLLICVAATVVFFRIKPLIFTLAKSRAETLVINCVNTAVLNILNENGITYDDISKISRDGDGNITGIEIDIVKINTLKSAIANETSRLTAGEEFYEIEIPLGTLTGYDPLVGMGPRITFKMQLTDTVWVDFESSFKQAGINQTLHRIMINTDININVLMLGCTEGFSVDTSSIAAQTVIVGRVPDAYTEVIEGVDSDFASDIFDFGAGSTEVK